MINQTSAQSTLWLSTNASYRINSPTTATTTNDNNHTWQECTVHSCVVMIRLASVRWLPECNLTVCGREISDIVSSVHSTMLKSLAD